MFIIYFLGIGVVCLKGSKVIVMLCKMNESGFVLFCFIVVVELVFLKVKVLFLLLYSFIGFDEE